MKLISDEFQRLLMMSEPAALSLNAQAALGPVHEPQRSQFSLLVRHFLERFFNHETASPDGDAKARLILIAVATGLPGFVVALYLWPVYHPFIGWPPGRPLDASAPPYWLQVNHHFFFVVYSFVAMGIITVFEWDLFFPDLLDVFVLTVLPIPNHRLFLARVASISIFIFGFLFDANLLAPLVIPSTFDPPNLARLLSGHILATLGSGLFSACFFLALQGVLLAALGERLFRRLSLLLQGLSISALLMLLLLFPVLSTAVPAFLHSQSRLVLCSPPFWFLGIYQSILEGPRALPIYSRLAQTGCGALACTIAIAAMAYPPAYLRKVRQLVVGPGTRDTRNFIAHPFHRFVHAALVRRPVARAVFHFISQTLFRVQRYRIYLVLYGGIGLSVLVASVLRLDVVHGEVRAVVSADGIRAAVAILAFWSIAGLRMAFVSPGNGQGSWAFRVVHGRPPDFETSIDQLGAAQSWVLLWSIVITAAGCVVLLVIAPPELHTVPAAASLLLIGISMCLLLTDLFFLNVKTVAFTGGTAEDKPSLAFTLLKYFTFIPVVVWIPVFFESWVESGIFRSVLWVLVVAAAHIAFHRLHHRIIREHCSLPGLEDDEDDFPMKLGLRY